MKKKISILGLIILFSILFKVLQLDQYMTLDFIKTNQSLFELYYHKHTALTLSLYFLVYVLCTSLSLPGATPLTLLGGALFGFWTALLVVSFASTLGATLAFILSRSLFKDWVETKFKRVIDKINAGIQKEGAFYLFTLRLVPAFPFFLINLCMGVTQIRVWTFYWVSQIGMLAGTLVYVNAGVRLGEIENLQGIFSAKVISSFVLLGIFPLFAKRIITILAKKKVYQGMQAPKSFDYNMVVIGAGAAGLVTSYISAAIKAKVALVEKEKMGGDCLNTGCVPSKTLIKSAKMIHQMKNASLLGIEADVKTVDFAKIMARVHKVISQIEPHDSVERYTALGVECLKGKAQIISPWEVKVGKRILTTKNITIATGARPIIPEISGIQMVKVLTSSNLWQLKELPQKFLILGAGPIGLEMAQAFNRLGSKVTIIERDERILAKEDEDVSAFVQNKLTQEGVEILLSHHPVVFKDSRTLLCKNKLKEKEIDFDQILVAVGRKANIEGFGLEKLGIRLHKDGSVEANEYLQTNFPNIYVCGDVTGPYQLTHAASHQAWHCAVNGLFSGLKQFRVDYAVLPRCTFVDPEIASVGMNESECLRNSVAYDVTSYDLADLDRAIVEDNNEGFIKVITAKGKDRILGATLVCEQAGELIAEFVTAMKNDKGLNSILGTVHAYPTMSEANKMVAGVWKKEHTSAKLLSYLEKFQTWRRS